MNFVLIFSIIIIIVILIYIIYKYRYSRNYNPILFPGAINGYTKTNDYNEDGNSYPYKVSISSDDIPNQGESLIFGYSFWLYLDNIGSSGNWEGSFMEDKQLINRGDSPSIYYKPKNNSLVVKIKTGESNIEIFTLDKALKSQKWMHICVALENRNLDVYIDGKMNRSFILKEVPKLNTNDIYIFDNGNIYAEISYFRYFTTSLTPSDVSSIYNTAYYRKKILMGPRGDTIGSEIGTSNVHPYPIFLWWIVPWRNWLI